MSASFPSDVRRYSRRARFCVAHGKYGYRTRRKALRVAQQANASKLAGHQLTAYPCPSCGLFHLTSQVERAKETRGRDEARRKARMAA